MLSNLAVPAAILARNSKTKKALSGCAILSQMGDSAGTTAIMGLDSERRHSGATASTVYDITQSYFIEFY